MGTYNLCFIAEIRKRRVSLRIPFFYIYIYKRGLRVSKLHRHFFVMCFSESIVNQKSLGHKVNLSISDALAKTQMFLKEHVLYQNMW